MQKQAEALKLKIEELEERIAPSFVSCAGGTTMDNPGEGACAEPDLAPDADPDSGAQGVDASARGVAAGGQGAGGDELDPDDDGPPGTGA